jgi:hypothetical protein
MVGIHFFPVGNDFCVVESISAKEGVMILKNYPEETPGEERKKKG